MGAKNRYWTRPAKPVAALNEPATDRRRDVTLARTMQEELEALCRQAGISPKLTSPEPRA